MTTSSRSRVRRWLTLLEAALVVVALGALGYYAGVKGLAAHDQASWAKELDGARATPASNVGERPASARPGRAVGFVGRIESPRVGLSAMVRQGVDARTLRSAVGHVSNTALPGDTGNAVFAAHRDTFFRPLQYVRQGDPITVTTAAGVFHYAVRDTWIVDPSDVSVLAPTSDPVLTLVTCYPFDYIGPAPQRFVVRAARVP
jgi:sortase A